MTPFLWQGGKNYPSNYSALTQLLADREIDIGMAFNIDHASNAISEGKLKKTVRSYIHENGTLANVHFLSIPYNSSKKDAAQVFINFLISPKAQLKKQEVNIWHSFTERGEYQGADPSYFDVSSFDWYSILKNNTDVFKKEVLEAKGEIFIPKMPSIYIKDLMKTIYPEANIKIIGIRPGEKIDELLISKDESLDTYIINNGYVLLPSKLYFNSKLKKKLKKFVKNFEYNSKDNVNFLSKNKIQGLLNK